jgi:serine phosphatase RsbU (regulator of sigma subunit)
LFLYIAATNEIQALDADQPPLGTMFGGEGSVAREIPMEAGDALILVTDGFFECNNASGEMLGAGRLGELFQRHMAMPAAELIQRVYAEVLGFCGGTQQSDDLTAVVIKNQP